MKGSIHIEGIAFACGIVLSIGIWLAVHGPESGAQHELLALQDGADKPSTYSQSITQRHVQAETSVVAGTKAGETPATAEAPRSTKTDATSAKTNARSANPDTTSAKNSAQTAITDITSAKTNAQIAKTDTTPAKTNEPSIQTGNRPIKSGAASGTTTDASTGMVVRVYLEKKKRIEQVSLEDYVRGVVSAEMPADFSPSALEAQALAARTYVVRRLVMRDTSGVPVQGADITDTVKHQAYHDLAQMKQLRKYNADAWKKIDAAVSRTRGQIIVYDSEPIQAFYFSTSNGFTESVEDVFGVKLPYLRSVASPWDAEVSPRASETIEMPLGEFYAKLGLRKAVAAFKDNRDAPGIETTAFTSGRRVKTLKVGDSVVSGLDVRERLELRSASFELAVDGNTVRITTYGSGHGVGMSQWGAEGMARKGFTAEQIVKYYYRGTELMEVSKLSERS
jgi:stage II sporulation protein D